MRSAQILVFLLLGTSTIALAQNEENAPAGVDCGAFAKRPDGNWTVTKRTTVTLGRMKINLGNSVVSPKSVQIGSFNLFNTLNEKCGGQQQ